MGQKAPSVTLEYDALIKTQPKSWLLNIQDKDLWFPKSRCSIDEDNKTIEVPEWIVKEKGLSTENLPSLDHKIKEEPREEFPF